jgi:hypothetical protein
MTFKDTSSAAKVHSTPLWTPVEQVGYNFFLNSDAIHRSTYNFLDIGSVSNAGGKQRLHSLLRDALRLSSGKTRSPIRCNVIAFQLQNKSSSFHAVKVSKLKLIYSGFLSPTMNNPVLVKKHHATGISAQSNATASFS